MKPPQLGPLPDAPLGVAVSGGGDSVALLMLLHRAGHNICAASVDHQLRPEAAKEAADVAALCAEHNIPHDILVWENPTASGNLQNEARKARRRLLADWARTKGLKDIVLGHTLDDQAETVLMRLARGSAVDGLAGMAARRQADGMNWHRPMLGLRRTDLRAYLRDIGIGWVDDPSNEDLKYDRIKARKALDMLASLGVGSVRLAETADHMRRVRNALEISVAQLAHSALGISACGEVTIEQRDFADAPREIQLRLLSAVLKWVGNADYRPRFTALESLLEACLIGDEFGKTLHGCTISNKNNIVINREFSATPEMGQVRTTWDGRWETGPNQPENTQIRALGADGLQSCTFWRDSGHSRAALMVSPSLWREELLIAAPMANYGDKWLVNLVGGKKDFYDQLITH